MFASYWQKISHGSGYPAFFFALGKAAKAQETQSYQRFQCIGHTDFNTSGANGPCSLSRVKVGTHSAFRAGSHTAAHTPKQGAFRMGVVSLPSERFARFGNPARPGVRTANFAAFGAWSGVLPKNAESLRNSDAHAARRCSEASRPRWVALLHCCFLRCTSKLRGSLSLRRRAERKIC